MLVVETIAKIRRAYFAQNKPIKMICREFRLSRRVVRKVIAMVFKLVDAAQKSWRRLDGHNQLPKLIQGVRFTDGIEVAANPASSQSQPPDPSDHHQDSAIALCRLVYLLKEKAGSTMLEL